MRPEIWLIVSVAILFSLGLLMVFNATSAEIIDRSLDLNTHRALLKQITYAGVGLTMGYLMYQWGYASFIRWSTPLLIFGTLLLGVVFAPGIGQTINGSRRWLFVLGYSFQPSECIKLLIPAFYIRWYLFRAS